MTRRQARSAQAYSFANLAQRQTRGEGRMNNGQTPLTLSLRVGGGDCAAARWPLFWSVIATTKARLSNFLLPFPSPAPYIHLHTTDGMTLILGWPRVQSWYYNVLGKSDPCQPSQKCTLHEWTTISGLIIHVMCWAWPSTCLNTLGRSVPARVLPPISIFKLKSAETGAWVCRVCRARHDHDTPLISCN